MERQNAKDLRLKVPGRVSSFPEHVAASPITELAMNFESICTRTPTGPTKCTPRRKLSLGELDNNSSTPILSSSSLSRRLSSESGYCPSPDGNGSQDSPSADFISSRKHSRSYSKVIRRPSVHRCISSPGTQVDVRIPEEKLDENNNKENVFEFAKPTLPLYRRTSSAGRKKRPASAPPELSPDGSFSKGMRNGVNDEDDGFIDYTHLDETEDETFQMPLPVAALMSHPLSEADMQVDVSLHPSHSDTPKGSGQATIQPCDLFHPISCNVGQETRTKRSKSLSVKRPVPPRDPSPEERKKLRGRCSSALEASWNSPLLLGVGDLPAKSPLQRSMSVVETKSPLDFERLLTTGHDNNLIGDFSKVTQSVEIVLIRFKQNILPTISGQHQDLKTIMPETVIRVLDREFTEIHQFFIVDCRYPYEYEGGHIRTAMNLHTKEGVYDFFMKKPKSTPGKRTIVIFHCEFSSKRAPSMYRYLRNKDRDSHKQCYPKLFYPEIYVVQGGYKAFFQSCKEYCEPQTYTPMIHENFTQEYKRFSKRSKSWNEGQTGRKSYRQGLKF